MSAYFEYYKVFYYVARYRSITQAAQELSLTQPSVTRAIQNLETQLGCQLFARSKKGVALTTEGEMIYQRIVDACELLFSAEEEIEQVKSMNSGIVKIGTDDLNIRRNIFLPCFQEFRALYPQVKLRIVQRDGPEMERALETGTLDFYVVANSSREPGRALPLFANNANLEARSLGDYPDAIIVGEKLAFLAGSEITLETLSTYPLIAWAPGTATRAFLEELYRQRGLTLRASIELTNIEFQILLTERGLGYSFVPLHCVADRIRQGTLFPLTVRDCPLRREVVLMTSRTRPLSFAAQRFLELLRGKFTDGA